MNKIFKHLGIRFHKGLYCTGYAFTLFMPLLLSDWLKTPGKGEFKSWPTFADTIGFQVSKLVSARFSNLLAISTDSVAAVIHGYTRYTTDASSKIYIKF